MRPDTPMPIASVTKPLTAALAVALGQAGRLSLDDRLSRWVPRYPNAREHLAAAAPEPHKRALQRRRGRRVHRGGGATSLAAWTPAMVLRYVREPYGAPGSVWHYSDTNYTLMGLVLQRASGTSVAEALHLLVLDDHGMRNAALEPEEPAPPDTARGYPRSGGRFRRRGATSRSARRRRPSGPPPAWSATAPERGNLGSRALRRERPRPPRAGRDAALRRDGRRGPSTWKYGLGVAQRHIVDRDVVGASGRFWGYSSELWRDPATRATVAVLWNDTLLLHSPDVADTLLEVVRRGR